MNNRLQRAADEAASEMNGEPEHPIIQDTIVLHLPPGFNKRESWHEGLRFVIRRVDGVHFRLVAESREEAFLDPRPRRPAQKHVASDDGAFEAT